MTPKELLDQAKARFIVLYHNDPAKLELLLRQSLAKYADRAGVTVTKKISFTPPELSGASPVDFVASTPLYFAPMPVHFRAVAMAKDAKGLWHDVEPGINPVDNAPSLVFQLNEGQSTSPMTVEYFVELRGWDLDEELPVGVSSAVLDHLIALIAIPNTERERAVAVQAGQQVELPGKTELEQRVDAIEMGWEESAAFVGSTVIW
jgi:hypothetical protein